MSDDRLDEKQITESEVTDEDESETDTLTAEGDETKTDVTTTKDDYEMETDHPEKYEICGRSEDTSGSQQTFTTTISAPSEEELRLEVATCLLPQDMLSIGGKHIKAEDSNWAKSPVPLLSDIIVEAADTIEDSELQNFLKHATEDQKQEIFRNLPLTLSLKTILPLIEEGIYWKRMCLRYFPSWSPECVWKYSGNWKSMFVHLKVEELIASFVPDEQDIWELVESLQMCSEHVTILKIERLVKAKEQEISIDLSSEDCSEKLDDLTATAPSAHFLDFERLFECFLKLKKLEISLFHEYFDLKNPHFSIPDFNSLLKGLRKLNELRKFEISNVNASNEQIIMILKTFLTHKFLTELDLTFNMIEYGVCDYVRELLISRCPLESLILQNNKIKSAGAKSIAAGLRENRKLKKLDLNFNEIGDEGARFLARVLQSNSTLEDLDIRENWISSDSGIAFAKLIKTSKKLKCLMISDNNLGESAGKLFARAVAQNSTLLQLDVMLCGFRYQDEDIIKQITTKNRSKTDRPYFLHW